MQDSPRSLIVAVALFGAGMVQAQPGPVVYSGVEWELGAYLERPMRWGIQYRMYKYLGGEKVYGEWIDASNAGVQPRRIEDTPIVGPFRFGQAFDSLGQNLLVGPELFGFEVCGFGSGFSAARYRSNADYWTETWDQIIAAPGTEGTMIDGVVFGWQPNAIRVGSGPFSPSPFELWPGQHAPCHQIVWNVEIWDSFDLAMDEDGLPSMDLMYPVLDAQGLRVFDGDGDALFTPADYSDSNSDGSPDDFLGGYQLFVVGGFFPGDTDDDGTPNTPRDYVCPDLNGSGDPFDDFFNPIVGGGWTTMSNYPLLGPGEDGFLSMVDSSFGRLFDIDGDGVPDVPRLPLDGVGALRIETLNAIDPDLDGTFDAVDGAALTGGVVFNGTDEAFAGAPAGMHPVTPGDSHGLTWVSGEDRIGAGGVSIVQQNGFDGIKPATDDAYTFWEIADISPLPGADDTTCVREPDATAASIYVGLPDDGLWFCADSNLDGRVDPTDFGAWLSAYGASSAIADANNDNVVSPTDFGAWLRAYNVRGGEGFCDFDLAR